MNMEFCYGGKHFIPEGRFDQTNVLAIDEWPHKFEIFTRILQRIKELDGLTLSWR